MQKKRFSAVKRPIYIVCENEKGYTFFEKNFLNCAAAVIEDAFDRQTAAKGQYRQSFIGCCF